MLVVSGDGQAPNLTEGRIVQVTGELRRFNLATLHEERGADVSNERYRVYEKKSAIFADRFRWAQDRTTTSR